MQADRSRTPEQNLAHDLGLLEADLVRIVRRERARDRAERLVEVLRACVGTMGNAGVLLKQASDGSLEDYELSDASEHAEYLCDIEALARAILAEIDAPIGGA